MSWLRRNRLALGALVVLVPLTVFATAGLSLLDLAQTDPTPVPVANKAPHTSLGATWKVRGSHEFAGTGKNGIPVGSALVAALVDVSPAGDAPSGTSPGCTLTLEAPGSDGTRSWQPVDDPSQYNYVRSPGTVDPGDCAAGPAKRETIEVVFLTPEHTIGDAGIVVQELRDRHPVRFRLALHDD